MQVKSRDTIQITSAADWPQPVTAGLQFKACQDFAASLEEVEILSAN